MTIHEHETTTQDEDFYLMDIVGWVQRTTKPKATKKVRQARAKPQRKTEAKRKRTRPATNAKAEPSELEDVPEVMSVPDEPTGHCPRHLLEVAVG